MPPTNTKQPPPLGTISDFFFSHRFILIFSNTLLLRRPAVPHGAHSPLLQRVINPTHSTTDVLLVVFGWKILTISIRLSELPWPQS